MSLPEVTKMEPMGDLRLSAPLARHRHDRLYGHAFFHHSSVDKAPVVCVRKIGDPLRNRIRLNKRLGRWESIRAAALREKEKVPGPYLEHSVDAELILCSCLELL